MFCCGSRINPMKTVKFIFGNGSCLFGHICFFYLINIFSYFGRCILIFAKFFFDRF